MASIIKMLKEKLSNNIIYPITKANAVYMTDNTTTAQTHITDLETKVGTATLNTSAKNLCGAVNELNSNITSEALSTVSRHSNTGTAGTLDNNGCYRIGKVVCASGRLFDISLPATGYFFMLPSGYRPKYTTRCMGFVVIDNVVRPTTVTIGTNGEVGISYSANLTAVQVGFAASFPVA